MRHLWAGFRTDDCHILPKRYQISTDRNILLAENSYQRAVHPWQELFENHKSIEVINTSAIYLFSLIYLFKIFQLRFVQFESKIPASVFITLDQYVSIKYFEPKISKNFKIDVETKFITLKNPNSVYLQFVCSDYSGKRGYTFYALTENETKNSFIDKIRLKNLKKQIHSENKGKVLFPGCSKKS